MNIAIIAAAAVLHSTGPGADAGVFRAPAVIAAGYALQQGRAEKSGPAQARGRQEPRQSNRPAQARGGQGQSSRPAQARAGQGQSSRPAQARAGQGQAESSRPAQARPGQGHAESNRPAQARPQSSEPARGQARGDRAGGADRPERPAAARGGGASGASAGEHPGRAAAPGRRGGVSRQALREGLRSLPPEVRRFASSARPEQRIVAGAAARGVARGMAPAALIVDASDDRVRVLNRERELLLDLDDRRARELGAWELRRLGDQRPTSGSPSFCRSGEGHPVWGRQWCIDKGFGLGGRDVLWSRGTVDDIRFGRGTTPDRLDRGSLIDVLGDVVFGRLALHALTLGYDRPLVGTWVAEPEGPRLLKVYAGDRPVAELVDADRDGRVEVLYVAHIR